MSKEINRRGFLALGAGAVAATAVGAAASQADGKKELGFYDVVTILNSKVAELMEKSKGRFCPKYNTPGYIVVPKSQEGLLNLKNQLDFSVLKYCRGVWPMVFFIDPHDIDIVWKDGKWCEERLPDDTWAIIDSKGYGATGEDSFVYFKM